MYTIYHNSRCSKSREALAFLQQKGVDFQVKNYLETPPTASEIMAILQKLGYRPRQLLRTKETEYLQFGLDNATLTDEQIIAVMAECPKLIERPIVVTADRAIVARPTELLQDFC